jgi:hypothetical protein
MILWLGAVPAPWRGHRVQSIIGVPPVSVLETGLTKCHSAKLAAPGEPIRRAAN